MTDHTHTYRFVIDAWDPARLPMARLAEYMSDLAGLFGQPDRVHFDRLETGSAVLVQHVDDAAIRAVRERLDVANGVAPADDIAKSIDAINLRLAEDQAIGSLHDAGGAEVLRFLGRDRPTLPSFGPLRQDSTCDGVLIRVGGKDDTVPVHLDDRGTIHVCNADREMARRLAPHLYGGPLRVHGSARWERRSDGNWRLRRFDIKDFEELDDRPLAEVVQQLRSIPGSAWGAIGDPVAELRRIREGYDPSP